MAHLTPAVALLDHGSQRERIVMTMHKKITINGFMLVGLMLLIVGVVIGADEEIIKTPQPAAIQFKNGQLVRGTLLSVKGMEIRFQLTREGTVPINYKLTQIAALQTMTDIYIVKNGQLEKQNGATGKPEQKNPEEKRFGTQPEENNKSQVIAEGIGATADEALKDAFRNAVRQVVGAVVDAETLVKNDEVISDKVLTYSDGFIKKYDEISKKQDKGLIRIKITAEVERRSVIGKLTANNVKVKDVDGKGLFAEAVTELEAEKNAEALLKKNLEGFPQNCLTAAIGQPKIMEKNEKKATVQINVQLEVNQEAYKDLVRRLQPLLDKISSERGVFIVKDFKAESSINPKFWTNANFDGWMPLAFKDRAFRFKGKGKENDKVVLALCTNFTKSIDRMEYRYYIIHKSLKTLLVSKWLLDCKGMMRLLDQGGDTVATDRFDLNEDFKPTLIAPTDGRFWLRHHHQHENAVLFFLSPTFVAPHAFVGGDMWQRPRLLFPRTISLSLDELKAIQKAKVEIQ